MRHKRVILNQSGQGQLLAATVVGTFVLSGALMSLQWAQKNRAQDFYASRRVEMRSAVEQAVKIVGQIYTAESGCDPVVLDRKLANLTPAGLIGPAPGLRQLQITINGNIYMVGISHPGRMAWSGSTGTGDPTISGMTMNTGTSQDAIVDVWTTYNSTANTPNVAGVQHQRVNQRAVLINTCTYPCSAGLSSDCPIAADTAIAYHRLQAASFPALGSLPAEVQPGVAWNRTCFNPPIGGTRYMGDFNLGSITNGAALAAPDGRITVEDLQLLKNYVRTGDWSGAAQSRTTVTYTSQAGSNANPCADFNGDSMINETDLHIMEKAMRGYLYWLPAHSLPPPPPP